MSIQKCIQIQFIFKVTFKLPEDHKLISAQKPSTDESKNTPTKVEGENLKRKCEEKGAKIEQSVKTNFSEISDHQMINQTPDDEVKIEKNTESIEKSLKTTEKKSAECEISMQMKHISKSSDCLASKIHIKKNDPKGSSKENIPKTNKDNIRIKKDNPTRIVEDEIKNINKDDLLRVKKKEDCTRTNKEERRKNPKFDIISRDRLNKDDIEPICVHMVSIQEQIRGLKVR